MSLKFSMAWTVWSQISLGLNPDFTAYSCATLSKVPNPDGSAFAPIYNIR